MEFDAMMPIQDFIRWCSRPPQAIAVVLVLMVLVGAAAFFAGRMKQQLFPPAHMTTTPGG
ncbi:MAG: hypothetical protein K2X60_01780 [Xanthobacteraceae bacterium]|nr:hypothetical protein [Xanthobacteraceae bacterium]